MATPESGHPVYMISVAAELAGMHPQTLRGYDRLGLVSPGRSPGRGRRYSERDVEKLREVQRLSQVEGVNLAGMTKINNNLYVQDITVGTGTVVTAGKTVSVIYTGWFTNGSVFDSSVQRGEPATFPLNGVIPCWTEGVQQMKVGGKSRLVCPSNLAYGDRGAPPRIKPGAALVFEVELLEIVTK